MGIMRIMGVMGRVQPLPMLRIILIIPIPITLVVLTIPIPIARWPLYSCSALLGTCLDAAANSRPRTVPSRWIFSCKSTIDWINCSGRGGQPGA